MVSSHEKEHKKHDWELKPNVNEMSDPDDYNPGPTDMIEEAVGEIVDNISGANRKKSHSKEKQ